MRKDSMIMNQTLTSAALQELEDYTYEVLQTYSNVHRGSGPFSMITTRHYEDARNVVLAFLGLEPEHYVVIFCSPRSAEKLAGALRKGSFYMISSDTIGLSIGIRAMAVRKGALPKGSSFQKGGGTAKLISPTWVIWAAAPGKFEAGTPAIVNVIIFARALQLIQKYGNDLFVGSGTDDLAVNRTLFYDDFVDLYGRKLLEKFRETYISINKQESQVNGKTSGINLDNSASTPTFRPIWEAFRNSYHIERGLKHDLIKEVRHICADFLNASEETYELLFCSNTTEAINLAAENLDLQVDVAVPVVLSTLLEHSSNDLPWRGIPGCELLRLSVDENGFVDLQELGGLLREYNELKMHGWKRILLLSISGASNVLGVCNDLGEISRIVHHYGAKLLVDAAQLVAHRKIDVAGSDIDYLAFSGHKVYAPFGSGMLLAKKELLYFSSPELENIKSSGEENIGGIVALGKSLSLLGRIGMDIIEEEERALTARLLKGMNGIPGIAIYGIKDPSSQEFRMKIGVVAFNLKNFISFKVGKELARLGGIGIRAGCHCSHITVKHILNVGPGLERFQRIMQTLIPRITFPGVARVSIGIENSEEDVDLFVTTLGKIAEKKN